jgi:uncharacterized Zn finger protein
MTDTSKIKCPDCSAAMNHHAVKLEYDSDEPGDPVFEGVVKNVHTCPDCGAVEMITA